MPKHKVNQKQQIIEGMFFIVPAFLLGFILEKYWGYIGSALGGGLGAVLGLGIYTLLFKRK